MFKEQNQFLYLKIFLKNNFYLFIYEITDKIFFENNNNKFRFK